MTAFDPPRPTRPRVRAGLVCRVHVHACALCYTHAAELRCEGIDIGRIARQRGHASIATTARYLDHVAPLSVAEAMRNGEWTQATGGRPCARKA